MTTRREYLIVVGTAVGTVLAGCSETDLPLVGGDGSELYDIEQERVDSDNVPAEVYDFMEYSLREFMDYIRDELEMEPPESYYVVPAPGYAVFWHEGDRNTEKFDIWQSFETEDTSFGRLAQYELFDEYNDREVVGAALTQQPWRGLYGFRTSKFDEQIYGNLIFELRGTDDHILQTVWDQETVQEGLDIIARPGREAQLDAFRNLTFENLRRGHRGEIRFIKEEA
jgi:hypothetical protein